MNPLVETSIVVIISAHTEWRFAKNHLTPTQIFYSPYGEWFRYQLHEQSYIFFQGGWGKISAAASAQYAISLWNPDIVVNLGTCGGFSGTSIHKGDLILADSTLVYDILEQMGDPQEAIQAYATVLDLSWVKIPPVLNVKKLRLISADRDIIPSEIPDLIQKYAAVAADWESGAIAWVCKHNHVKCLILRGVSDLVDTQKGEAYDQFNLFIEGTRQVMIPLLDHLSEWFE